MLTLYNKVYFPFAPQMRREKWTFSSTRTQSWK